MPRCCPAALLGKEGGLWLVWGLSYLLGKGGRAVCSGRGAFPTCRKGRGGMSALGVVG